MKLLRSASEKKLGLWILIPALIITARLILAAGSSGNWRGFFYSILHVIVVAAGSYVVLRHTDIKTD